MAYPLPRAALVIRFTAMIAQLHGILADFSSESCIVNVGGVGYLVYASSRTLTALGVRGDEVMLYTKMLVSENDMRLIGFATTEERDWHGLLTSVQGVGGKVALAILSALSPAQLAQAIGGQDKAMMSRPSGVGPKLAARILNELKDKVAELPTAMGGATLSGGTASAPIPQGHGADAVSALQNLGFKPVVAERAVAQAMDELEDDASLDAIVRLALKKASS